MRVRRYSLPLFTVLSIAFIVGFAPTAGAQITQPDITGHGSCYQAPNSEPAVAAFAFDFDSFLRQRSAQMRAAAAHWLPLRGGIAPTHTRPASLRASR